MNHIWLLGIGIALIATPALADCRDDLTKLHPVVERMHHVEANQKRFPTAESLFVNAMKSEEYSEVACLNDVSKLRKFLSATPQDANNDTTLPHNATVAGGDRKWFDWGAGATPPWSMNAPGGSGSFGSTTTGATTPAPVAPKPPAHK